ncbi:MAG: DUF5702 domain-containing protein [Anaerovoracaceae bacterium]|jgi:hypothetical protein
MKSIKLNKRGSTSIFLMIILAAMISVTFLYIRASIKVAAVGYCDGLLNLSARSVLSEYNKELKEEYGIFAFYGMERDIEDSMKLYINYTLDKNDHLFLNSLRVDVSEESLLNTNAFEQEIIQYTKYAMARGIIDKIVDPSGGGEDVPPVSGNRVLRNKRVIDSLPSAALGDNGSLLTGAIEGLGQADQIFKEGSDRFFTNQYIMMHFKNAQNQNTGKNTFFVNEAEYILKGKLGDEANRKAFRRDLILLRNVPNLIFIYADPVKRSELATAAALITPGPGALLTQLILAEAWALAESENDVRLLEHGKKVPVYKTPVTWAVDLQSIVDNTEVDYIDTKSPTGLTYQGYLQLFLFFQDRSTQMARMMDLIQINMQGNHDASFLIRDYNLGFDYKAKIDGREYVYKDKY